MADYITLVKRTWLNCGLSGSPPPSVEDAHSMHGRVVSWVREANAYVQQLYWNWSFLWKMHPTQLKVGQATYTAKELGIEDFHRLARLSLTTDATPVTNNWVGIRKGICDFDPLTDINPDLGLPQAVVITKDGRWVFDRAPDVPYWLMFEYYRVPQELEQNFDEPLIPKEWQHIIIHRAKMLYAMYDESASDLASAQQEYKSTLTRMEAALLPPIRFPESPFHTEAAGFTCG
jgi:hypothetical protein